MLEKEVQPVLGIYLSEVKYSYDDYQEACWNMKLLSYYPVNLPWLKFWGKINEALFRYFYEDTDEGELEQLLNSHQTEFERLVIVDDLVLERLVIGFKILNSLASPTLVHARISFNRIAAEVGISLDDLEIFIPEMYSYYDWEDIDSEPENYDVTDLFASIDTIDKFNNQSQNQRELARFSKALDKTGHKVISYRFRDFQESEGKLFTRLFVYLLNVIAQRKRTKLRKYLLEYSNHSDYVQNSFGLRKQTDKKGRCYLHDDLIGQDFEIDEILKLYHLDVSKS
ncbi:hypothetical protein D7I46_00935 [Lactococcus allomyrinae]|uniref:Uncharacterized protein n=2 Tax=Lactococcus allomyrinae TaxID=2419773 RepID=A0A387B7M0_9LACT|nr:hypothetical protein D7I46_00935 [Lactococcus allomyrinae]